MLLPHNCSSCLAGVVAMLDDVKSTHGCIGRCYSQVADGIATGSMF